MAIITIILILLPFIINSHIPTIAILANPTPWYEINYNISKVYYSYVRWIENAGGSVIIIQPWEDVSRIKDLFNKVDGFLFQGGARNLNLDDNYEKLAKEILNNIILNYEKGIHKPLWATCLGFELLHSIIMNKVDLDIFDAEHYPSPISDIDISSNMFSLFTPIDIFNSETEPLYAEFHKFGISEEKYIKYPQLDKFLKITSYAYDMKGSRYIASVEGRRYPIYGVQFHPEKIPILTNNVNVPINFNSIRISQSFANFFINEARRSKRYNSTNNVDFKRLDTRVHIPISKNDDYFYLFNK